MSEKQQQPETYYD